MLIHVENILNLILQLENKENYVSNNNLFIIKNLKNKFHDIKIKLAQLRYEKQYISSKDTVIHNKQPLYINDIKLNNLINEFKKYNDINFKFFKFINEFEIVLNNNTIKKSLEFIDLINKFNKLINIIENSNLSNENIELIIIYTIVFLFEFEKYNNNYINTIIENYCKKSLFIPSFSNTCIKNNNLDILINELENNTCNYTTNTIDNNLDKIIENKKILQVTDISSSLKKTYNTRLSASMVNKKTKYD